MDFSIDQSISFLPKSKQYCNKCLGKTYSWAMYAYAPQVVVFLGDLIDEGSEADEDDYLDYVIRFKNIYSLKTDKR